MCTEKETLLRTKQYLESTMNIAQYLNDKLRIEHRALYVEVYNRINPDHPISEQPITH